MTKSKTYAIWCEKCDEFAKGYEKEPKESDLVCDKCRQKKRVVVVNIEGVYSEGKI